jgi:DNA-binding Xre family transcriptional regulator
MTGETGRSLQLTTEQLENANTALSKFGSKADLAAKLGMSRTTINNFFKGEPVQRKQFHDICKKLKLDWQPESPKPSQDDICDIDELVREVRSRIHPIIHHHPTTLRHNARPGYESAHRLGQDLYSCQYSGKNYRT